jgi:hypothetical protein
MNKRGLLGNLLAATIAIALAVALLFVAVPVIKEQMGTYQANITGTPSSISGDLVTMLDFVPWVFAGFTLLIVILVVARMLRSGDGVDGYDSDNEDDEESDDENDDDSDDDVVEEDEESEPEPAPKKQHSTRVITKKKDGNVRTNVTLNPTGYNVDKYELTKPTDTKLSLKEANFNKTKYD